LKVLVIEVAVLHRQATAMAAAEDAGDTATIARIILAVIEGRRDKVLGLLRGGITTTNQITMLSSTSIMVVVEAATTTIHITIMGALLGRILGIMVITITGVIEIRVVVIVIQKIKVLQCTRKRYLQE
jgi:hypothetical protein